MTTEIITNKLNPAVIPHLHIWGWEIPLYLFLGGLAGGLLVLSSAMILFRKNGAKSGVVQIAALLAPTLLGLGMLFLFLDLAYKVHVWRFYTAFNWTSPMSWGSWMLVLFFPLSALQAGILIRDRLSGYPGVHNLLERATPWLSKIAVVNAHMGVGIAVYTGVLLSSLYARPLWSNSVLGVLFLFSGLSGAAALMLMMAPKEEKELYAKIDMYLISLEGFMATMFILGGINSSEAVRDAMKYLISGSPAPWFWILFVLGGMLIPLLLETLEALGRVNYSPIVPAMILIGSLSLRFVIVYAGQSYPTFAALFAPLLGMG